MLQGRLFSYGDAQRYRLGVNHQQIPVNAPRCPVHSYHRDGAMRVDGNHGSTIGYEPNTQGEWQEQPDFSEPPLSLSGAAAHWDHREDEEYFSILSAYVPTYLLCGLIKRVAIILSYQTSRSALLFSKCLGNVRNCKLTPY